jgi:8-oxo-dGTP pyrophosphatase MutT (NUDIX family)
MNGYSEGRSFAYAYGQVLVVPFEISLADFLKRENRSLDLEPTVLIAKTGFPTAYVKFAGGMHENEHERPEDAAIRELFQETGVVGDSTQVHQVFETRKERHYPDTGTFPVRLMLAFGCDFTNVFNPEVGEFGDEYEITIRTTFGAITKSTWWEIPTQHGLHAQFFPPYMEMLVESAGIYQ